jgi:hypothetical protein
MLLQLQIAHYIGPNGTGGMSQRGATKTGVKFIGNGRAANLFAAFQHQRFESSFGQIKSRYQPIVATSDDDDISFVRHKIGSES